MARPTNPETKTMIAYGAKLPAEVKLTFDTLASVLGKGTGQREILVEMLELYREAHPDVMERVDTIMKAMSEV